MAKSVFGAIEFVLKIKKLKKKLLKKVSFYLFRANYLTT